MKRIKYIILGLVLTMSFSACQDWLTILPDNEQTSDQYWNSKEEVESVLANGYICLRNCIELMYIHGEARGKTLSTVASAANDDRDVRAITRLDILPTNKFTSWANFYKVINMANSVIKYAPGVVGKDDTFHENAMRSWLGEAYYLRALSYFYLIRIFKEVPYITEPYVDDSVDYEIAKTNEYEIMGHLLEDLYANLSVMKEFFEEADVEDQRNSKGRATRWAVYALIADIHLWRGDYQECINACNEIINSGWVGLIRPTEEEVGMEQEIWFSNFGVGNTNESVFEIQYSRTFEQYNDNFISWFNKTPPRYVLSDYMYKRITLSSLSDERAAFYSKGGMSVAKNIYYNIGGSLRTSEGSAGSNNAQNVIIYRLAEIYLMKAEALVMQGFYVEAVRDYVNPLRDRVNAAPIDVNTLPSSELEMLKIVLSEREMELLAEGKSWFDILRIAKRNGFQYHSFLISEIVESDATYLVSGAVIESKLQDTFALYMPISSSELNANQLLEQNPYYENLGR